MENIIKTFGDINKRIYGVNPFEKSEEKKFDCEVCEDKGYVEKTEWSGTDNSYDVEVKCSCQDNDDETGRDEYYNR